MVSSTQRRTPHPNNKQDKNTNPTINDRFPTDTLIPTTSLSLTYQSKNKQVNKQKLSTKLTLCKAYTNPWTNLRRAETKRKEEFNLEVLEKETSNTIS